MIILETPYNKNYKNNLKIVASTIITQTQTKTANSQIPTTTYAQVSPKVSKVPSVPNNQPQILSQLEVQKVAKSH